MGKKYSRPELESKRQAPLAGGDPGSHGFVRTATVIVGPDDTCDFIGTTDAEIEAACAWVLANYGGGTVHLRNATYTGSVTMDESNIILEGEGWDTIIDGGVVGSAVIVTGDYCVVRDLQVKTDVGQGNAFRGIECVGAGFVRIDTVFVNGSDNNGMYMGTSNGWVVDCYIFDADDQGIYLAHNAWRIIGNRIEDSGTNGIDLNTADNCIVTGNYILTTGDDGIWIRVNAEDNIVSDNRISGWTGEPVDDDSGTSLVSDNDCGGRVMNSKGCSFLTVQLSVTHLAGDGWVEVPDGTFPEAVTIANNEVLLRGRGWGSIIDGALVGHAIAVNADRVTIQNLQCKTTQGGTNAFDGINVSTGSSMCYISNVYVSSSDQDGIYANGTGVHCVQCYILNCDRYGIDIESTGDWSIITSNWIQTTGNDGIFIDALAADCVVHGNKILGWTNQPIDNDSVTSWVADNWCGGRVMNSKGCSFLTVQLSVNHLAGDGWVEVPEGTFPEAVTIANNNVTLRGQSWGSIIDGGIIGHAINVTGDDCQVYNLQAMTTKGGGNAFRGIRTNGNDNRIIECYVSASDVSGIYVSAGFAMIINCKVYNPDSYGMRIDARAIIIGCNITDCGTFGIAVGAPGDYTIISNNYINTTGDDGILIVGAAEYCVVDGNRISNWTNEPIDDDSGTSWVSDNHCGGRVMNSKGCSFATIALSLTYLAGGGWVEVPVGTWSEAIDIVNHDVILRGHGWDSIINGGVTGTAIDVTGDRAVIEHLCVRTTTGQGNPFHGVYVQAGAIACRIINVFVWGSDDHGILLYGTNGVAQKCYILSTDGIGFATSGVWNIISECIVELATGTAGMYLNGQTIVSSCVVTNVTGYGIQINSTGDDSTINGNFIHDTGNDGVYIVALAENCIVIGNRIKAWTNECIDDDSGTSTIGANECTV